MLWFEVTMITLFVTHLLFFCASNVSTFKFNITKVTSFPINYPGFTTLYKRKSNVNSTKTSYDLLIGTFNPLPFATDSVQIVSDVGNFLLHNSTDIKPSIVTTKVTWPNEISGIPENIFERRMVAIPDGFLVPTKTDGSISLVDLDGKGPYKLTDDQTGKWFYHRVLWKDMDLDGDLDILTCRAREPVIGFGKDSEMLWLENPGTYMSPWRPHVLVHGPDIFVTHGSLNTTDGPRDVIIAAQFFTKSLTIYWVENGKRNWSDTNKIKSRVIDNTIGNVFDVTLTDLNFDGKADLLVTNNGASGSLFAYEVPSDFRTGDFKRRTLAAGFKPRKSGTGKGAPGAAMPVHPFTKLNGQYLECYSVKVRRDKKVEERLEHRTSAGDCGVFVISTARALHSWNNINIPGNKSGPDLREELVEFLFS